MTSALPRTILVTGAAGFIGSALSKRLLSEGCRVIGIDDFNSYYPVELKEARVADIGPNPAFTLVRGDISDKALLEKVFSDYEPEAVVNLAAQAGVRYSIENPGRVYALKPRRVRESPRMLPAPQGRALRFRELLLRLRKE